jgi:TusE/DsrC/DsvC family sulfur relay protein
VPIVRLPPTDAQGYLCDRGDWTPAVAEEMAAGDGMELTDDHWEIIRFLREYYDAYGSTPPIRLMTRAVGRALGEKKGNSRYLHRLFPKGPALQCARYAGLPRPVRCT